MSLFVTSYSAARGHGIFGILRSPPATIRATGTARTVLLGQFPWGPTNSLESLTDPATFLNTVAPPGMSRTGSGWMAYKGKGWPDFKWVRVTGSGETKATRTLSDVTPTVIVTLTGKYEGAAGNSITATVSNATDGDAQHFNLTVTVTGATGTTSDLIQNLNYSGVGADSAPDLTSALLLGAIAKNASGRPLNGTSTFTGGADGSIVASDYVGVQGTGDKGMALLESDNGVDGFFVDDCGNSLRAAVNAGGLAHADYMTDRVFYMNGNSAQSVSATKTDVASYRSLRVVYVDPWVRVRDDVTGALTLVPSAGYAASTAAQLSPSTPISWKSATVRSMLRDIVSLEALRGAAKTELEEAGVVCIIPGRNGGFVFESQVVTNAPSDPATKNLTRTRMAHYIGRSEVESLQEYVDSPNVPLNQQDEINAIEIFLGGLKLAATTDPNNLPHILDFSIPDIKAFNPQAQMDAGIFVIPQNIKISAGQSQIFMSLQIGETVNVSINL